MRESVISANGSASEAHEARSMRRRLLCYWGVAVVNIGSALLPVWPWRYRLLAHRLPLAAVLIAQNLSVLLGIAMLLLAYPAARRHRGAARALMLCAGLAILANIVKGLDVEEAAINTILLISLWRARHQFEAFPLRYTWIDLARIGVLLALLARLYSLAGSGLLAALHLLVLREKALFPWLDHLVHMFTAKLELQRLWFHESQLLVPLFLLTCFLILSWRSAWHSHLRVSDGGDLYGRFGRASHNSLAYIANRSDVSTFIDPAGRGAITYRQVGRVALQVGAILSGPADRAAVYASFRAFCKVERLIPAAVALTADERLVAAASGMRSLSIGTEAVVDLPAFASERLGKKMRWAQRSLQKRGYTVELLSAAEVTPAMRIRLDHIDREWRDFRGGQAHGYCMTLGRFPTNDDPHCLIAIARDATGAPIAYLTLLPGGEGYYSLDLTRRSFAAPNATIEFLLIEVLTLLRARGALIVSLNFSTLSSLSSRRGGALLMRTLGKAFQLGSLEAFNAKFRPRWEPRFLVFPTWWTLPDVVYAILVIEGVERMAINACARVVRRAVRPPAHSLAKPVVHAEHA